MKKIFWLLILLFPILVFPLENRDDFAHHPKTQDPHYIEKIWFNNLKASLPSPPKTESQDQKKDEQELYSLQKTRSEKDCERALSEVHINLATFYGPPYGPLTAETTQKLLDFFETLRNESDYFVSHVKKEFNRPRPFAYLKDFKACIPKESSSAYPSGHAAVSEVYARVLIEFFPTQADSIRKRQEEIMLDRVLGGVHHPSDVQLGKKIGDMIFEKLMGSDTFKQDLAKTKTALVSH